jgi:hypothetical protein
VTTVELSIVCAALLLGLLIATTGVLLRDELRRRLATAPAGRYAPGAEIVVHPHAGSQSFRGKAVSDDAQVVKIADVYALTGGDETAVGGAWSFPADQVTVQEL